MTFALSSGSGRGRAGGSTWITSELLGVTQSDLPVRLALDPEQKLSDEQFLAMLVGRNVSHKGPMSGWTGAFPSSLPISAGGLWTLPSGSGKCC